MERGFRPRQVRARIERLVVAGPAFPFHHGEGPRVVRARRFPPALGLIRHAEIDEKQRCQTAIWTFDPGRLRQQAKQCLASLLQVAGAHPGVPDAVMCPEEVRVSFREMLRVDALGFLVEPQPLCVVAQIDHDAREEPQGDPNEQIVGRERAALHRQRALEHRASAREIARGRVPRAEVGETPGDVGMTRRKLALADREGLLDHGARARHLAEVVEIGRRPHHGERMVRMVRAQRALLDRERALEVDVGACLVLHESLSQREQLHDPRQPRVVGAKRPLHHGRGLTQQPDRFLHGALVPRDDRERGQAGSPVHVIGRQVAVPDRPRASYQGLRLRSVADFPAGEPERIESLG